MTSSRQGPAVRIIAIGDELLEGRTTDTNSNRIERALGAHAVQVSLIQVVPDREEDIAAALDRTEPGDLVFITGGLGSTPDDLTRDVVARWGKVDLVPDPEVMRHLTERWRKRGLKTSPGAERQAEVPVGMTALTNPVGSAPGLAGPLRGRTLILLPGVPQEMTGLLGPALDWLDGQGLLPVSRESLLWRTAQVAELTLVKRLAGIHDRHRGLSWSWWLTEWGVDLRLAAPAGGESGDELSAAGGEVDAILGRLVYSRKMETPAEVVQGLMLARGATLAVAESCTGGLIGGALTAHPGSSGYFRGGILAYADHVKSEQLGVPADVLARQGAVSRETVELMAAGCRARIGTDYALAVSGISGPGGGTEEKPVGTTWIGLATPGGVCSTRYRFPADRERNRLLTVAAALDSLRRVLESGEDRPPWDTDDSWCRGS